jgi:hypothetical protein
MSPPPSLSSLRSGHTEDDGIRRRSSAHLQMFPAKSGAAGES